MPRVSNSTLFEIDDLLDEDSTDVAGTSELWVYLWTAGVYTEI